MVQDIDAAGSPAMNVHAVRGGELGGEAATCCAFCRKPLPVVNGVAQPWRAPNGQFFCNEFCADDAEEANFQQHLGRRTAARVVRP
jgi:hypothetical protein